jgi:hypothetical protein
MDQNKIKSSPSYFREILLFVWRMKKEDKRAKHLPAIHKLNANIPQKYKFNKDLLEINEICEADQISQALSPDKQIFHKQPKHGNRHLIPGWSWGLFSSSPRPDQPWDPSIFLPKRYREHFPGQESNQTVKLIPRPAIEVRRFGGKQIC